MEKLMDTDFLQVLYYPEKKRMVQNWSGFINTEDFKKTIDQVIALSEKYKIEKILSDTSKQSILKMEATDYAASVVPKILKNGVRKMAFLVPENIFAKLSVNNFIDKSGKEEIKYFANKQKAEEWLDS